MSTDAGLGTLGFHVDGRPCRVACEYCYLGVRPTASERSLDPSVAADIVARIPARDVAVSVSEPAERWRPHVEAIAAAARATGRPFAVTTTADVLASAPWVAAAADRVTLSIDPAKGSDAVTPAAIELAARSVPRGVEVIGLVSLVTPEFSHRLRDGLLAAIVGLPSLTGVGLNGLKPPPPWCDRAHWLAFFAAIRPLLSVELNRRLFLDCYVSARILGLSDCPGKADVAAGREFRSCVYQREPDFVFADTAELARRVATWQVPAVCPFPIV